MPAGTVKASARRGCEPGPRLPCQRFARTAICAMSGGRQGFQRGRQNPARQRGGIRIDGMVIGGILLLGFDPAPRAFATSQEAAGRQRLALQSRGGPLVPV